MGDWMFAKLSFFQSRFVRSHCFRIPSWNQSVFQCEHVTTKQVFSLNIAIWGRLYPFEVPMCLERIRFPDFKTTGKQT